MPLNLRPYQERLIDDIGYEFSQGKSRVCAVAPCGAGKTVMAAWMARGAAANGKRVLFMVHRQELIEQTSNTFAALGIRHGLITSKTAPEYDLPVQIASVQTLVRRLERDATVLPPPDFIICDECHHIVAGTYRRIIDFWPVQVLGITATPERLGGQGLGDVFNSLVLGPTVSELVQWGNLSPFDYYAPPSKFDSSEVRVKFGEFVQEDLAKQVNRADIIGDTVKYYRELAGGKRAICYCVNRAHSEHMAEMFTAAGITAMHVDGETAAPVRSQAIADFRAGKIKILCNAELFGEGFDVPAMEAVILARPTALLTLYIQQAMRAMRRDEDNPDKRAVIIDHVGNVFRHGLPDEEHEWTLETKKKKRRERATAIKICPDCFTAVASATRICPHCNHVFLAEKTPEESAGVLVKIDEVQRKQRRQEVGRARTVAELERIARERGYSMRWVSRQIELKHIDRTQGALL